MPYMYIFKCCDGSYYTGNTTNLERRLYEHEIGIGAIYTKKRLPVKLVYYEEYERRDEAFYREKQIQGWSKKKKETIIEKKMGLLEDLSICNNETSYKNFIKVTSTPIGAREQEI